MIQKADKAMEVTPKPVRAMEMRATGFTYRQIGETLGVCASTAHGYVKREISKNRTSLAETRLDARDLDLSKIAWLERKLTLAVNDGDLAAGRLLLAAIQLRRSYLKELPPSVLDDFTGCS